MNLDEWFHWRQTASPDEQQRVKRETAVRVQRWLAAHPEAQSQFSPRPTYTGADARFLRDLGISPR
jgi:hypothetical protein